MTLTGQPATTEGEGAALAALLEQLAGQGVVAGCGCGRTHPRGPSALDTDPGRWRRIRRAILRRDRGVCQVATDSALAVPAADGSGVLVCGSPATVCGHVLSRALGGCDHPDNLRAECKPHSDSSGAVEGNQLRAAIALVQASRGKVTQSDDLDFYDGVSQLDVGSPGTELEFAL